MLFVFLFIKEFIKLNTWLNFISYSFILLFLGYFISLNFLFEKKEKDIIYYKIKSKIKGFFR